MLLDISSRGAGWSRRLVLRGDGAGSWLIDTATEGVPTSLHQEAIRPRWPERWTATSASLQSPISCGYCAMDCCPVSAKQSSQRHGSLCPICGCSRTAQRYTSAGSNLIQYDALDGSFSALITVDDEGLVIDYPGIAHRI